MDTNSTTEQTMGLSETERRVLAAFPTKRFRCAHPGTARACAALIELGLMESDVVGGVVVYRTNDLGRAEVKRAGGSK